MAEVTEGTVLDDRYRVINRIGSGGMADVWLAEDTHLHRQVALKVLHSRFAQDREFVERFRREAEAAAGLQHPNIVGVFDRGEVGGTYYIAMAYLQGRSLKELIDAGLPPIDAVRYVRQILEGARFAHRHGVIHRDLKPQNVIIDAEGKATVTDFGIARAGVSEITQTGSVMGTAHYLSPEQAQGFEVTAASDLYSVGVILYQCLTGRVPFGGESAVAVALAQVSQPPTPPSELNPEVSPALEAVVMKALEKDPAQRFRSADEFIAALDAALAEPGAIPTGTPVPVPVTLLDEEELREQRNRRNRRIVLALLALLIGLYAAFWLTRETSKTYDVPDVTGKQLEAAKAKLKERGLDVDVTRVTRMAPAGQVLEQDPPKGEEKRSRHCGALRLSCEDPHVIVTLSVSSGPGSAPVPTTRGLTEAQATQKLEAAGFKVETTSQTSDKFETGTVIASDPNAKEVLLRGQTVTLVVSSGPKLVVVPAVVGVLRGAAVQMIRARNLVPSVTVKDSDRPEGEVLEQSPGASKKVAKGSTVAIVVSKGVQTTSIPNVIGDERPAAVNQLRADGFTVDVQVQDTDVEAQDGRVTDQFPSPGTEAQAGTTVSLVVGHFVPNQPTTPTTPTTPTPPTGQRSR
jgi:serine/threonine-protein kinase